MSGFLRSRIAPQIAASAAIWKSQKIGGLIAQNEFFDSVVVSGGGLVKVFISGNWQEKPLKVFISGNWQEKPVRRFDGTTWV